MTARCGSSLLHYVGFIASASKGYMKDRRSYIKAGTELTYNYNWKLGKGQSMQCMCGQPNCKGVLGQDPAVGDAPALFYCST